MPVVSYFDLERNHDHSAWGELAGGGSSGLGHSIHRPKGNCQQNPSCQKTASNGLGFGPVAAPFVRYIQISTFADFNSAQRRYEITVGVRSLPSQECEDIRLLWASYVDNSKFTIQSGNPPEEPSFNLSLSQRMCSGHCRWQRAVFVIVNCCWKASLES